jgi:hypothetical protein
MNGNNLRFFDFSLDKEKGGIILMVASSGKSYIMPIKKMG